MPLNAEAAYLTGPIMTPRKKQTQIFENKTGADLVVYVEMTPERYVLRPDDVMHITFEQEGNGYGLHTIVHDGELQIYLENFPTAVVTINGEIAESWEPANHKLSLLARLIRLPLLNRLGRRR